MAVRVSKIRGKWTVLVQSHRVPNKSGRLFRMVGPSDEDRAEAERIAKILERTYGEGGRNPLAPRPVSEALEEWLVTYGRTMKRSTEQTASGLIRNHLIPALGDRDVRELRRPDLLAFAAQKAGSGASVALVKNALSILRRVLNLAVEEHLIAHNPAARIGEHLRRLENREAGEVRAVDSWTRQEVAQILALAATLERRIYPIVLTAFHTGARRGELLGLQWRDIDFARRRVHIRRARVKGRTVTPKSGEGRFTALSQPLAVELGRLREERRNAAPWREEGWVFPAGSGRLPMQETTFFRSWARLVQRFPDHQIRSLVFHCTRHTFATLALEAGRNVKWVAEQLGHSDPTITLRTYAHALPTVESDLSFLDFAEGNSRKLEGNSGAGGGGLVVPLRRDK